METIKVHPSNILYIYILYISILKGIGEETQDFGAQIGVQMTFYTNQRTYDLNALCQFWDMNESQVAGKTSLYNTSIIFLDRQKQ